jgi:hypothetical protein
VYRGRGGGCSEDKGLLAQLPDYLAPTATVLAVILAYVLGRRQTEHEQIYTRRVEVIAALFERYEDLNVRVYELLHPADCVGEPNILEQLKLATETFNELQDYYRRHSIWLSPRTSRQMEDFIERYRAPVREFTRLYLDSPEVPAISVLSRIAKVWKEIWKPFEQTSLELRGALEEEFRAALGYRRAKIARFWRSLRSNWNDHGSKQMPRP